MQAVIDDLLHAGRVEDRHHPVDEDEFGLVGVGRGFRGVVVAHQADHTAMRRGPGHVAVAENIARAVDTRPLAVPEREDAVIFALALQFGLLGAPDGGGGEVLVQAGLEDDIGGHQRLAGPHQLLVEPAQRRAAIARDEAGGVQAGRPVALALHQEHARDRLGAGEEDLAGPEVVLVVERDGAERSRVAGIACCFGHGRPPDRRSRGPVDPASRPVSMQDMSARLTYRPDMVNHIGIVPVFARGSRLADAAGHARNGGAAIWPRFAAMAAAFRCAAVA